MDDPLGSTRHWQEEAHRSGSWRLWLDTAVPGARSAWRPTRRLGPVLLLTSDSRCSAACGPLSARQSWWPRGRRGAPTSSWWRAPYSSSPGFCWLPVCCSSAASLQETGTRMPCLLPGNPSVRHPRRACGCHAQTPRASRPTRLPWPQEQAGACRPRLLKQLGAHRLPPPEQQAAHSRPGRLRFPPEVASSTSTWRVPMRTSWSASRASRSAAVWASGER
mmetsp:Transcript_47903/g.150520  ORF Transcript_47903/g.150520 Transcript_47903/m.150520 type:complete len:220 (-) Transcript_47903:138-797(-)